MNEPTTPGLSMQRVETMQCSCNGCESIIPRTNVVIEYDRNISRGVQTRRIKAYCDHCSIGYEITQELRNAEWSDTSGVTILDKRARERLLHKLAPVRRERQLAYAG